MKGTELMIGNYFYPIRRTGKVHLPDEVPFKVLEINMFEVLACMISDNPAQMKTIPVFSISDLSPIPLTPEILERCGFETYPEISGNVFIKKYNQQGELIIFNGATLAGKAAGLTENDYYYFFHQTAHTIKYLHQLQNLFFALTGEELNIEL